MYLGSRVYTSTVLVNILCLCRSFSVQVDEEGRREAALPNDQPVSLQRVFLGGIPADVEQTSNRANVPFQGCIWNLMVNAVYVPPQPMSLELRNVYVSLSATSAFAE